MADDWGRCKCLSEGDALKAQERFHQDIFGLMATKTYPDMTDAELGKVVRKWLFGFYRLLWICESPIEFQFGYALFLADIPILLMPLLNSTDYAVPQCVVAGRYRVDFLLSLHGRPYTVECDGHDFHERTKQQARRDRRRDRDLQALGFRALRFTGQEIFESPQGCVAEILKGSRCHG